MPRVSVLMPVFNASLYLGEAITSILQQTFTDWELIIVNDGSSDNSKDVIDGFNDERIRYFENDSNRGLIYTLNRGIDLCSGEYVARMDADDISLPDRIRRQVEFLDKNPSYVLCGGNAQVINHQSSITGKIVNLTANDYLQINLLFSVPFVHPSVMLRREVLVKEKYDKAYPHVEDFELWTRISHLGKIANLPDYVLKYRWHETNISRIKEEEQQVRRNNIIRSNIEKLGLSPSEHDIWLHTISFKLYQHGAGLEQSQIDIHEVGKWYTKLVEQNRKLNIYNQDKLQAFLWTRWIVLCLSQNKKVKMFSPPFRVYKPIVILETLKLLLFLKKKQ